LFRRQLQNLNETLQSATCFGLFTGLLETRLLSEMQLHYIKAPTAKKILDFYST